MRIHSQKPDRGEVLGERDAIRSRVGRPRDPVAARATPGRTGGAPSGGPRPLVRTRPRRGAPAPPGGVGASDTPRAGVRRRAPAIVAREADDSKKLLARLRLDAGLRPVVASPLISACGDVPFPAKILLQSPVPGGSPWRPWPFAQFPIRCSDWQTFLAGALCHAGSDVEGQAA